MQNVIENITNTVVPVVVIDTELAAASAEALMQAVIAGGSNCIEITLRTEHALAAIAALKSQNPEFSVGAGTVIDKKSAKEAIAAGCDFMVSPGLSPELIDYAHNYSKPLISGVMTPSEAMQACNLGLSMLKFFPASAAGGVGMLAAFQSVYPQLKFMPTGGISLSNIADFCALPNVFAVGGSWVCTAADISNQDYANITSKLTAANDYFAPRRADGV